ncbi:kininogen-1-like [Leptopilina boulardi]|uniref:kininogen-1-like n=1 Tax=Leptopilina boulardi TaxID=63433 RepID=UPI0021F59E17|nr:kininogen-1-like [Leptopilina boulardi]
MKLLFQICVSFVIFWEISCDSLVGNPRPVDVNKDEIQQYAKLGLAEYSRNLQKSYEPLIETVISATEQVVSGTRYIIKVKFTESTCSKGEKNNECLLKAKGESEVCIVDVWSQPWEDKGVPKVTVKCQLEQ